MAKEKKSVLPEVSYCLERARALLLGATIVDTFVDGEGESWGLLVQKHAPSKRYRVWIDRDEEANGPGWISIEEEVPTP